MGQPIVQETEWGRMAWLAGRNVGNAQTITLGRVIIKRGCRNPRHGHRESEEVLHLLRGRLRHSLGDEVLTMGPGDTVVIPAGVFHNAESVGTEDAEMIVAYPTGERDFVKEGVRT